MPQYRFEEFEYRYERAGGRGPLVRKLLLPPSLGHKRVYEQAARREVASTTIPGAVGRRIDDPLGGKERAPARQVAIWQKDERQARYERPLMLYSHVPGKRPLLVMGLGLKHVEELKDMADEHRHYGRDETEIPAPLPDYNLIMDVLAERARAQFAGRHVYGGTTAGLMTKDG